MRIALISKPILERILFAVIMAMAGISRLLNLGYPPKLVFDEAYYVKDALTLSLEGHEKSWPEQANSAFESGSVFGYLSDAAFVVHPPFGKWLIASGMWLFGPEDSFGWRFSTALLGILTVLLLMIVAFKLFRSRPLALAAGFLLAIDGQAITLSRTALLDTPLTFFLLLGFFFLLLDQEKSRFEISQAIALGNRSTIWLRPWLILSGFALGAAASIKWSGFYMLAGVGLYVVFSEMLLRKNSGEKLWQLRAVAIQGPLTFLNLVPSALVVYLSSWLGWILGSDGYARNWAEENSLPGLFGLLPNWLQSLWHYHEDIYRFHINLRTEHAYEAHPIGWLIGLRPTAFFYESYSLGENGCQIESGCSSAITALGNPLIWISATGAILFLAYRYVLTRERTLGLILLGVGALYLPWLVFSERTVFQFYAVSFQPYMILALVLVQQIIYRSILTRSKVVAKLFLVGFFALALLLSLFFLPVNLGIYLSFELWQLRMWLPSWI
jgi:dolichyl-phosphate-mannose--protein O-mannosyl transferase